MMDLWFNHVKSYTQDILAENADNLKQFETRPGIYSNVDPADLRDVRPLTSTSSRRIDHYTFHIYTSKKRAACSDEHAALFSILIPDELHRPQPRADGRVPRAP